MVVLSDDIIQNVRAVYARMDDVGVDHNDFVLQDLIDTHIRTLDAYVIQQSNQLHYSAQAYYDVYRSIHKMPTHLGQYQPLSSESYMSLVVTSEGVAHRSVVTSAIGLDAFVRPMALLTSAESFDLFRTDPFALMDDDDDSDWLYTYEGVVESDSSRDYYQELDDMSLSYLIDRGQWFVLQVDVEVERLAKVLDDTIDALSMEDIDPSETTMLYMGDLLTLDYFVRLDMQKIDEVYHFEMLKQVDLRRTLANVPQGLQDLIQSL